MSSDVPEDNVSMLEIIQAMKSLANDESSAGVAEQEHTVLMDVDEVKSYVFPLAGQTIAEMLQDAEHLCNEISDIDETNRQIYDRLEEVYEQLVGARTSFPEPLVDDFSSFLWRFLQRLEQGSAGGYSTTVSLCASRTIANKNFGLHHDIDRLILGSPCLHSTAQIHQWQPQWRELQSEQQAALKACLERPIEYLNELPTENMRGEALAVMQFEAGGLEIAGGVVLPRWFIPPYQIEIEEHIAEGSFGSASKGRWLGAEVVIKQVLTDQAKRENRDQFRQELDLWFALNHPNLIKLYGACHEGPRPFFVCELAPGGTLTSFVRGKDRKTVWRCLWYAAWGLGHLHERGIIHGDLKGNNILMGKDEYSVKLADFGLSVSAANSSLTNEYGATGAFRWKAPECLLGRRPTFASDIYSFGMCIIEAITGDYPWGKAMRDEAVKYQVTEKQQLPKRPESFLDVEWELIERMCCFNPDERISALALIQSAKRIQQWYSLGYLVEGEGDHYRRHQRLGLQFG